MKTIIVSNLICKIGKNKNENWELLEKANEKDILFHLESFPSCYVILEVNDNEVSENVLKECCKICKSNTKYRSMFGVYVNWTKCSNVIKGKKIGELKYISMKKIFKIKV